MAPRQNELYEAALEIAGEIAALRRGAAKNPGIEFGMEKLSARDHANRMFGPSSSPATRRAELERLGTEAMVKLARTYQGQNKGRNLIPPGRG